MTVNLTYKDFAMDELLFLTDAYGRGMRYNTMVSMAQRICEMYMKQIITNSFMNNNEVMVSHNLRSIYDYVESLGINIKEARNGIMLLNNFYTHTRYPGRDAFIASVEDVESAVQALFQVVPILQRCL